MLWYSRDGQHWEKAFSAAKDRWNETYFQFGSLVLPRGHSGREVIAFSGQAVKAVDGKTVFATLSNDSPS